MASALALGGCSGGEDPPNCVGHAAASDPRCQSMQALYGGEILLEALILPDLTEVTKVTTFVVQDVDFNMNRFGAYSNLPTPPPEDGSTVCTQYDPNNQNRWPLQDLNLEANEQTIDVGDTITFSDGAGHDYVQARNANGMDTEGRTHDFVYTYVGDGLPPEGAHFTSTMQSGAEPYTEVMKGGVYSPMNIQWNSPAYTQGGLTIDRSQPMTLTYTQNDPEAGATGTDSFHLLAIYGAGGPPEDFYWLCLTENDSEMNIPQDVISTWPDSGLFIIGNIAHYQPRGTNGRVMHQIGRYCRVQTYTASP